MIPGFQEIMLPLLKQLKDGKEYQADELLNLIAPKFNVTEDEKKELLPSGKDYVFRNRIGWAKIHMKKAGLIDNFKRGYYRITERGIDVLKQNPALINISYLNQFKEFAEFRNAKKETDQDNLEIEKIEPELLNTQTPEELLEESYQSIRKELAQDILERILKLSPSFFERLVVELLVKMGYGGSMQDAGRAIGKSGDEGIDGVIKEDKLGLDIIYIQAKRWQPGNIVGRPEIHKFIGALVGQGAKKGIFITTSSFTKDAVNFIPRNETKVVLIDGIRLSQLMIDYSLGVTLQHSYEIKKIDSDYFEE
ncbi:MAG: restriction endonuclease [Dysgonamonadaceae bacterium]|jgi:restriction system protein|nr:restriction endonuclease [Dysgonamonadaceae bacterium]